jgi:DNA-directed RNA polymerase-5 subunit 1
MMSIGIKKRFNNASYKATFRPLKVQVPLTESTLFTPMKCMKRLQGNAILIHWDVWSHHVRGASMQYLALSHLLRICNENQLKGNKEYDDGLYAVLALVKTDQDKARYTFLEDVQQPRRLSEQNGIVEKLKIRMVSWKIEEQNSIRKQP